MNIVEHSCEEMEELARQLYAILRPGGRFCVEMADGSAMRKIRPRYLEGCEAPSGRERSLQHIPGQGTFPLDSYFWTVDLAKQAIGRRLALVKESPQDRARSWLVFRRT